MTARVPSRLPNSIRSVDGERRATLAKVRGEDRYYVSFYSLDRAGSPRFSTASPTRPLPKRQAYAAAAAWIAGSSAP